MNEIIMNEDETGIPSSGAGRVNANSYADLEKTNQIKITSDFINFNFLLRISAFLPIKLPIVASNRNKSKK